MAVHSQTMDQPAKRTSPINLCAGLLIAGFGAMATYDLSRAATERILPGSIQSVIFFGPVMLAVGCIIFMRGFTWGKSKVSRVALLTIGLVMLVIGACPWLYTSFIVGGRPGNEGAGMLGTIIFILIGLPGFAITLAGLLLRTTDRKKDKSDR
jgi:hypothetical protein